MSDNEDNFSGNDFEGDKEEDAGINVLENA